MTTTRPDRPRPGDAAPDLGRPVRSAAHGGSTLLMAAIGAAVMSTVALVLWYPIDMAAIERADDAGWDESLLHPHQLLLTAVLLGTSLCSWVTAIVTARSYRSTASSRGSLFRAEAKSSHRRSQPAADADPGHG